MTVMPCSERDSPMTSDSQQCVARLTHVMKTYGERNALQDLSMEIRTGEVLVLLGRNGAGKSTLVRVLVGLTQPTKGTVLVFGESPRSMRTRRKMGVQLQISQMPGTLRVQEYITLFSSYYANHKPFDEVVASAGLIGLEDRFFKQLSGGEQQRLRFALAICGNPELIVLDEPTAGMDVESRLSVWEQIRSLASKQKAVLLTTHHLEEADALADRVAVINAGKVIAEGVPKELNRSFAGKRIRCTSSLPLSLVVSMSNVTQAKRVGDELEIQTDDTDAIIRQLVCSGAEVSNIAITGTGLEESFLTITRLSDLETREA